MTQFTMNPAALAPAFDKTCSGLDKLHFADALWARQLDLWSADRAIQQTIGNRLGWLDGLDFVRPHVPRLRAFAESVRDDGFTDVVLFGMGGSSLAPEVLRRVIGGRAGFPRFRMLDSVDPDAVRSALGVGERQLFVLASKSGGTIEPNVMAAEARRRVRASGVADWGSRFVAITDADTILHQRAQDEHFRDLFLNPSTIGGRYSALSFFGTVPAALMGIDLDRVLDHAARMADACRHPLSRSNPGLALGAMLATAALEGRDKLTLLLPPRLAPFGLWVEQLVAESTGKESKGIVPITGEDHIESWHDRVGVVVHLGDDTPHSALREQLHRDGIPTVDIHLPDVTSLGAEFFRWEMATATAGWLLGINPFDEPNVQQAKDATKALLQQFHADGRLPLPKPHVSIDTIHLTFSNAVAEIDRTADRFLQLARPRDYVALLAYLPPNDESLARGLADLRTRLGRATGCATMFGYGPRYLHSTGQLHKGGPNTGVFVIVTAPPDEDLPIPDQPYTFGVLEAAQAVGDFQSLDSTGRRVVLVQLPARAPDLIGRTADLLAGSA